MLKIDDRFDLFISPKCNRKAFIQNYLKELGLECPVIRLNGKDHLYVWEKDENLLHENDAAKILYDISADENMHGSDIKEGKIELIADCDGVLLVDRDKLKKID